MAALNTLDVPVLVRVQAPQLHEVAIHRNWLLSCRFCSRLGFGLGFGLGLGFGFGLGFGLGLGLGFGFGFGFRFGLGSGSGSGWLGFGFGFGFRFGLGSGSGSGWLGYRPGTTADPERGDVVNSGGRHMSTATSPPARGWTLTATIGLS